MVDIGDRAQEHDQHHLSKALAHHHSRPQADARKDCIDCGDPIPVARRNASPHAQRCADCQTAFEGAPS